MRLWSVFRKSLREQLRGIWSLSLVVLTAPMMVVLYWMFFGGNGSTSYTVAAINLDAGPHGERAIAAIESTTYANEQSILKVTRTSDRAQAETQLKNRQAAALVIVPQDFSQALTSSGRLSSTLTVIGDLTNPQYTVAAIIATSALETYGRSITGEVSTLQLDEQPLGDSAGRTEFETYVPGVLIVAVVLLIFQAAMTVAREVEAGTLRRLQLSRLSSFELLGGISATQVLIGVAAVLATFGTATALGFRSQGSLAVAILIGAVTSVAVVGVGLIVACFAHTVSEAFILANFPLLLLMFFSGAVFPLPPVTLFTLAGRSIALFDFLPPTHAVVALNKVLTLGAGLGEVAYELAMLVLLSAIYFAIGVWLFKRTHLKAH